MRKSGLFSIVFFLYQIVLISQGTIETRSFYSPNLGDSKIYKVYLPADYYQSMDQYPVVYFLRNHEEEWFHGGYNGRTGTSLKEVIDELIQSDLIGKMIIVAPNTGSNDGNYSCCTVNILRPDLAPTTGIGTGKFEDYFLYDLINHIDTTFRTFNDQWHRGIDGFSLGGYSSMCTSLRSPEIFSSVGSYDGTIMWKNLDDPIIPGGEPDDPLWFIDDPSYPLKHIFDSPRNIPYMYQHSAIEIIDNADSTKLELIRKIRFHISVSYCEGTGNHLRNLQLIEKMKNKRIKNSWGNPLISLDASHDYGFADEHATASLIKHWQTFNGTQISAPTLINYSITETTGKNYLVTVFNYGPDLLTINSINTETSFFELKNLPSFPITILPENDSISFTISFEPQNFEFYNDTCFIISDDSVTPVTKIILRGKGGSFKAESEKIYGISSTNKLYKIAIDSLNAEYVGPFGRGWTGVSQLSVHPFSNELIGISNRWAPYLELVRINTKGGDIFKLYNIELSEMIRGIAFGEDSILYLATSEGKIFKVDPYYPYWNYPITQIAATNLPITSFAFNPVTNEFWAGVGGLNKDRIYKINIVTGDTLYVGKTGLNDYTISLTFDHLGNLYGLVGSSNNKLIRINTTTGVGNIITSLGYLGLRSIAISQFSPSFVEEGMKENIPNTIWLYQNFPNPFNSSSIIKYSITKSSQVTLKIFNTLGEELETLVNEEKPVGSYEATWSAVNLPSGVYFYRLQAGDFVQTRKMILLK